MNTLYTNKRMQFEVFLRIDTSIANDITS